MPITEEQARRSREIMEEAANARRTERDMIRAAALGIARELQAAGHGDWAPDTSERFADYPGTYLDGPDGARLYVRNAGHRLAERDRIRVTTVLPYNYATSDEATRTAINYATDAHQVPDATYARDRIMTRPDIVARDVARKILPPYREQLAAFRTKLTDATDAVANRHAVGQRMARAFRGSYDPDRYDDRRVYTTMPGTRDVTLSHNGATVSVEVTVSPDVAEKIAALILADRTDA